MARLEADSGPVVIKWFGWRNPLHVYLSPFSQGRAWHSWRVAHALQEAAVRTPEPLFVYARRHRGIIRDSFYISAAIHPHQTLRALLRSHASTTLLEQAVANLASSLARMHEASIHHRDLTTGNFLVDDEGRVAIVDLNRAKLRHRLTRRQCLADLARISFASRDSDLEERLSNRFFQVYGSVRNASFGWEAGSRRYRVRLLASRRLKRNLRRLLGRK